MCHSHNWSQPSFFVLQGYLQLCFCRCVPRMSPCTAEKHDVSMHAQRGRPAGWLAAAGGSWRQLAAGPSQAGDRSNRVQSTYPHSIRAARCDLFGSDGRSQFVLQRFSKVSVARLRKLCLSHTLGRDAP